MIILVHSHAFDGNPTEFCAFFANYYEWMIVYPVKRSPTAHNSEVERTAVNLAAMSRDMDMWIYIWVIRVMCILSTSFT